MLVSGIKSLKDSDLTALEPFDLVDVVEFKPEYLAGWPAILYDRSLTDASLIGRERVVRQMRIKLYDLIEIGREKRNVQFGAGSWSGITFKHILLPLWIGNYQFQGKEYALLINGQTGKVAGQKPRDNFKLILSILILVMFLILVGTAIVEFSGLTP